MTKMLVQLIHNFYLQLLAETGLISVVIIFLFYLIVIKEISLIIFNNFFYNNINVNSRYYACLNILIVLFPFQSTGNFFNNFVLIQHIFIYQFILYQKIHMISYFLTIILFLVFFFVLKNKFLNQNLIDSDFNKIQSFHNVAIARLGGTLIILTILTLYFLYFFKEENIIF